jgi:ligand-binding sensor domain-containing protein
MKTPVGRIWIASNGGIALYDESTSTFTRYGRDPADPDSLLDDVIYDLVEEPGTGNFWVATYTKGLAYWDRSAGRFTHYMTSAEDATSMSDNLVYALAMDKDGRLWAATNAGLNRYEGNGHFRRYLSDPDDPTSLPSKIIRDLHVDEAGVLWIATNGGGVARYRPDTDDFDHWTKQDGLAIQCGGIRPRWTQRLAVGRNGNRHCFYEPETGRFRPFTSFGDLRYGEFNVGRYRNKAGQLYFGALNTLYRIDPAPGRPAALFHP